jgi:hypothetical protein
MSQEIYRLDHILWSPGMMQLLITMRWLSFRVTLSYQYLGTEQVGETVT